MWNGITLFKIILHHISKKIWAALMSVQSCANVCSFSCMQVYQLYCTSKAHQLPSVIWVSLMWHFFSRLVGVTAVGRPLNSITVCDGWTYGGAGRLTWQTSSLVSATNNIDVWLFLLSPRSSNLKREKCRWDYYLSRKCHCRVKRRKER